MEKNKKTESKEEYSFKKAFYDDLKMHDDYITNFDAYESMLISETFDTVSKKASTSSITDSYPATMAMERAARVMGKLPEGMVKAAAKKDAGKAALMEIIRQKWIQPNANSQHQFLVKLQMWQLYSSVYGYMPMHYDWVISRTGYAGPDCFLWNPRNLIPQQGRYSINDMDYVTALSWVGPKTLEMYLDDAENEPESGWDLQALKETIELAEKEFTGPDTYRDTKVERERVLNDVKKGVCLATRYEAGDDGEWVTFVPDHGCKIVRRLKNPHKNGKIPFVIKYSQPLFDSFYGLGDFQRARPIQAARDGLVNFYFATLKRNLAPGIIVNANGVVKSTLDVTSPNPVIMETIPNSVRPLPTNTAGLSTFQAIQSHLTGSLLSLNGSQNASMPGAETLNPEQGKTPAAIKMFSAKEATRDGMELDRLEMAIEELFDGFFSMMTNIATEPIELTLFADEIQEIIRQGHEDVMDMVKENESGTTGRLVLNPKSLKGAEYRFFVDRGSTVKTSKEEQRQLVVETMGVIGKYQNQLKEDPRVVIEWGKLMQMFQNLTDVKGLSEVIRIKSDEELKAEQMQIMQMQAQANAEAMAAAQPEIAPPQMVNGQGFRDPSAATAASVINSL